MYNHRTLFVSYVAHVQGNKVFIRNLETHVKQQSTVLRSKCRDHGKFFFIVLFQVISTRHKKHVIAGIVQI
jgi:hypothetical protein